MSEANGEFDNRGRAQELKLRARRKNIQSILLGVTKVKPPPKGGRLLMVRQAGVDGAGAVEGFERHDHSEVVRERQTAE